MDLDLIPAFVLRAHRPMRCGDVCDCGSSPPGRPNHHRSRAAAAAAADGDGRDPEIGYCCFKWEIYVGENDVEI